MHTNPPTSNLCPWVTTFQGKFALSLSELSTLLRTPAAQLLYMARPSALNAPPPMYRFCILKPLDTDIYRVSNLLLNELSRPLSQVDEEKIDAFLKRDEPFLLTCGAYLWLSPHNCQQLHRYGTVEVSKFENGFHFDDLDIPRPILSDRRGLPSNLVLAPGNYMRSTATKKPCFTPSTIIVKMDDVYSLVQDLSSFIDFPGLEKANVTLEVPPPQTTLPELKWHSHGSVSPQSLVTPKPPEDEFLSKHELPESAEQTIFDLYYKNATEDLKLLMDAARTLWGEDRSDAMLLQKSYPKIQEISNAIALTFNEKLDVDLMKTDCDHLAHLIRPSILCGTVNATIERQRGCSFISKNLFGLFKISSLIKACPEGLDKPLHDFLMEKLKLKGYLAKVGAKALRGEFSSKQ